MASNINDAVVGAHSVAQTGVIETIGEAAQGGVVKRPRQNIFHAVCLQARAENLAGMVQRQ
jgi:hypothetical protein